MIDPADDLLQFERVLVHAPPLSESGRVRRDAMRALLTARVAQRRRLRLTVRAGVTAAALAAAAWLASRLALREAPVAEPQSMSPLALQHVDFAVETGDATRVAGWTAHPDLDEGAIVRSHEPTRWLDFAPAQGDDSAVAAMVVRRPAEPEGARVGDGEVLELLASAGRPTGLVRAPSTVFFTADVFDPLPGED